MKRLYLVLTLGAMFLLTSCGGGNGIIPTNPVAILGDWTGTYYNTVVDVGIIQATFYMDSTTLHVIYDLQAGEVTGDSTVSVSDREITFIGVGTKLQQLRGDVDDNDRLITGTIVLDYAIWGTTTGIFELNKIM